MFNIKAKPKLQTTTLASVLGMTLAALTAPAHAADYKIDTFKHIDVDNSGYLEDGEYKSYAFGRADWDNDGYLEETEWASYTEVYYDPYELDYDSYTAYDTDGDGFIDRGEFNDIPTVSLFTVWDYDSDDLIDEDDWDEVIVHYKDHE